MKILCAMSVLLLAASLVGCTPPRPRTETLPAVTLIERRPMDGTIMLRFHFTNMDRVGWKGQALRAQVVKAGKKPTAGGPSFPSPQAEFVFELGVGKVTEGEGVIFVPAWGNARGGRIIESQPIEFIGFDGTTNRVTVTGTGGQRLTQILATCTGPDRPVPFDPRVGIDLVTVGFGSSAYSIHVWAAPAPAPESTETDN